MRSMHYRLTERAAADDTALESRLSVGMRKVASEPECLKEYAHTYRFPLSVPDLFPLQDSVRDRLLPVNKGGTALQTPFTGCMTDSWHFVGAFILFRKGEHE